MHPFTHAFTPPPASNSWPDSESWGAVYVGSGELKQYTWGEIGMSVLLQFPKGSERRWWIHNIVKPENVRPWSAGSDSVYTAVHILIHTITCPLPRHISSSVIWLCPRKGFLTEHFSTSSQNYETGQLTLSRPSVCLSVLMERLGSHWMDCHNILYMSTFRKYV